MKNIFAARRSFIDDLYHADTVICLRDFLQVTLKLSEIFAHVNE